MKDRQFIGYMYSSMFWSELEQQWEIVDLRTDTVLARLTGTKGRVQKFLLNISGIIH